MHPSLLLFTISAVGIIYAVLIFIVANEEKKKLTFEKFFRNTIRLITIVSFLALLFLSIYRNIYRETNPLDDQWIAVSFWQYILWFCILCVSQIAKEE
jgi:O-antigen/teichoic acid export membrane protein